MLLPIPGLVMVPQEFPRLLRIRRHPGDCIEFVIAHDAARRTQIGHAAHQFNRCQLFGAAIDQVPDKDRGSLRVAPDTVDVAVSQMLKQLDQLVVLTVYIADDVKIHKIQDTLCESRRPDVANSLVDLNQSLLLAEAGANVISTSNKMLGTLLDVLA
jgi:delta-aminolevulinic acid dehydratase/porphobilinogen synthase